MVDMRKQLPDDTPNPHWRRYVPFEPFASIIDEYFRLFIEEYAGNLYATLSHIAQYGPYYPSGYEIPNGFFAKYKIGPYPHPTKSGLSYMFTNVAYLGHWSIKGAVVQWNTHEPIVAKERFMRAYNYLSNTDLIGKPNPQFFSARVPSRPSLDQHRQVERPICAGLLWYKRDGEWRIVGIHWDNKDQQYGYIAIATELPRRLRWERRAEPIDREIVTRALGRLKATFPSSAWDEALREYEAETAQERALIRSQIKGVERVKANLLAGLGTYHNDQMRREAEVRYEAAEAEQKRLAALLQIALSAAMPKRYGGYMIAMALLLMDGPICPTTNSERCYTA